MILVVGAKGFLGSKLSKILKKKKISFFKIDKKLKNAEKVNINNYYQLKKIFENNKIKIVINCACEPATSKVKRNIIKTNVFGNENLIKLSAKHKVKKFIFFSTSAIWVKNYKNPVTEKTKVCPVETYGISKVMAEKSITNSKLDNWTIFRVPMIVSEERLGVLSILFDFIINNKKIPILDKGQNLIQFIHIEDLIKFVLKSCSIKEKQIYNLGSEEFLSLKDLFLKLINAVNSNSKIISFKDYGYTNILSFLNRLNLSPLNIYHLKMLKYSLVMNSNKIKKKYNLKPKIKTSTMMISSLRAYKNKKKKINNNSEITSPIKMGVIRLLYYIF
jgi:nucleoside-diphosphate-sugar epimerase